MSFFFEILESINSSFSIDILRISNFFSERFSEANSIII